jgi:hypothetical protein
MVLANGEQVKVFSGFRQSSTAGGGRKWQKDIDDKQNDLVAAMSLYFFLSIYFHVKS